LSRFDIGRLGGLNSKPTNTNTPVSRTRGSVVLRFVQVPALRNFWANREWEKRKRKRRRDFNELGIEN
jgi:hypothetical protein